MKNITPEQAGISSDTVVRFIKGLERKGIVLHSVLMMRGDGIFAEYYWKPFCADKCHRMYSQTKSFVGIAVGLLAQDGKLDLDGRICDYFPEKIDKPLPAHLAEMTVRQMLTMQTCTDEPFFWFYWDDPDRTHLYLNENDAKLPAGMRWKYDSSGSQVLSALVEKLSGKSLFEFLDERIFRHLGTFRTAKILKTRNGDSWGDSAMVCTPRDIASFARLLMDGGVCGGKQLISRDYIREATSFAADNNITGFEEVNNKGYGYQIWKTEYDGFAFNGMGCQLTVCIPEKDLIFVCTGDNQGYASAEALILHSLYDLIVDNLSDAALPEDPSACRKAADLCGTLELFCLKGTQSPYQKALSGKTFLCESNPTGIEKFSFTFNDSGEGQWHYTNAQGEKCLPFGLSKNVFCKFPQTGYSKEKGGMPAEDRDFLYDCAVSAAWREDRKLLLKVQIIDEYLGNMFAIFSFRDELATVTMIKNAEAFLDEYTGEFIAHLDK